MKKEFLDLELNILAFAQKDVIATSGALGFETEEDTLYFMYD
jgi:hypothetical protein